MKKIFTFLIILSHFMALAQLPPPCPSNTSPAADFCGQACIYCNLNGIAGSTAGFTGQPATGFCGDVENEQWLGFLASETQMTFHLIPSNCQDGNGLQAAIYTDCSSPPLACNPGMANGGDSSLTMMADNLVPGNNYFLMVDGYQGDHCTFTITQTPPVGPLLAPTAPVSLSGPSSICPNAVVEYCTPAISGAAAYTWTAPAGSLINGESSPLTILGNTVGNCVTITFGSSAGVIVVNGANSCYTGPPFVQPIVVAPIQPTFLPDTVICQQYLPFVNVFGDTVNSSGSYGHTFTTSYGCDSIVRQFVYVKIPIPTVMPPEILCEGESFSVCGVNYFDQGTYNITCIGSDGCDSTVIFTLITPQLDAEIIGSGNLSSTNPVIELSFLGQGTPTWYSNGIPVGNAPTLEVTTPGEYVLELSLLVGSGSCSAFDTVIIGGTVRDFNVHASATVRIKPSISSGFFTIFSEKSPIQELRLVDLQGRVIFEEKTENVLQYDLDASAFASAAYQVFVLVDGKWLVRRIVKL